MGKWRALRDRAELHARVGTGKSPIREPEPAQDSHESPAPADRDEERVLEPAREGSSKPSHEDRWDRTLRTRA